MSSTPVSPSASARAWSFLRGKATGGTSVVLGTVVFNNVLRIASTMVLTRLLSPEAFGITAITTTIAFVVVMVSDLGFYTFVMRHADSRDPRFLDEIWTIRAIRGVVLGLVFLALAKPVALYVQDPRLSAVFWLSSAAFIVDNLSSLASITAVRDGQLRRLSVYEIIGSLVLIAANIGLAFWLRSYWALLWAGLFTSIVKTVLSFTMFEGVGRRFRPNRARFTEMWAFSRYIAASSALTLLLSQSDKLVLARAMSLDSFGKYSIAVGLAATPVMIVGAYVPRIFYPACVAAQADGGGDAGIARIFYRQKRLMAALYAFLIGGLIGSAHLLIAILYDARYASVATFLQVLAISTMLRLNTSAAEEALIASGRPKATLTANIARVTWVFGAGGAAVLAGRPELLVPVAGLIEVPALLYFSWALKRIGVFRLREELVWMVAAVAGIGIGWSGAAILLPYV